MTTPKMMLVTCYKRYVESFVSEFGDWAPEGAEVKLFGYTNKISEGFVLLQWNEPIPPRFFKKLKEDSDVIDYLTYDASLQSVPTK